MQEYDVALKLLLRGPATLLMRQLAGTTVTKWLDVELPKVQNLRLDLLGETAAGGLVHVELQSRNDAGMALRFARIVRIRDDKSAEQADTIDTVTADYERQKILPSAGKV